MDVSKLPPPATTQVDFVRDIQPILETSCLRCHGPQKPKSGYRLDNREAALKGGDEGVDIVSGDSAKSGLIHYIAGLDPDMLMPPEGKGDPLTKEQIGLMRAWIDQGAAWSQAGPTNQIDVTVSTFAGGTFVSGDNKKFREHYWRRDGFDGGIDRLELFQQFDPNTSMLVTGHAHRDDYKVTLELNRTELGFIRSGWQQYRQYYDDTAGYFSLAAPQAPMSLGSDLYLDIGKAWIDFGLTLPHWPRMVFGYEYDYKRGDEFTTAWGSDRAPGDARNVAPNRKHLDEGVHIVKFDLDADIKGFALENRFRGEFYSLNRSYTNLAARGSIAQSVGDEIRYFQGANSLRVEKKITDWLFGSGGYFYSNLSSDETFTDATVAQNTLYLASVPNIQLSRESHLFNLNSLIGPFNGFSIVADAQSEWTRQRGFAFGNLNGIAFTKPPGSNLAINPATLSSDYDQNNVTERIGLHYTKIPFTALFAEARLRQESIGQIDSDIQPTASFLENQSYSSQLTDFRVGFNTSPWQKISFTTHYRHSDEDSRFKTNIVSQPPGGYPGFISGRDVTTDEFQAKLISRPFTWLKATLTYQLLTTDYDHDTRPAADDLVPPTTVSPGGHLLAGQYDSHIYSLGMILTPLRRVSLSTTFSYQDTRTVTESGGLVPPYEGDVYTLLIGGTYIFNEKTDLTLNYSVSLADYAQSGGAPDPNSPPPLGMRYEQHALQAILTRRVSKNLTTRLQYGFYLYDEPTLAAVNNYTAHSIFAGMTYHFR